MTAHPTSPKLDPEYLPPGTKIWEFEVLNQIGRGGSGVVYLVRRVENGDEVRYALKLSPQRLGAIEDDAYRQRHRERVMRELRALLDLQHPNIVKVCGMGFWPGQQDFPYLLLELVEGQTLFEWRRDATPSLRSILVLLQKVASALQVVHERGVFHRDMKSDNVLVRAGSEEPIIIDFSVSRTRAARTITENRDLLGTLTHFAPEYCSYILGSSASFDFSPRTELYAFGYMVYELLTGRGALAKPDDVSFQGLGEAATSRILQLIETGSLAAPSTHNPNIPAALDELILRLLARDPTKRFGTAGELAAALSELVAAAPAEWQQPFVVPLVPRPALPTSADRKSAPGTSSFQLPEGHESFRPPSLPAVHRPAAAPRSLSDRFLSGVTPIDRRTWLTKGGIVLAMVAIAVYMWGPRLGAEAAPKGPTQTLMHAVEADQRKERRVAAASLNGQPEAPASLLPDAPATGSAPSTSEKLALSPHAGAAAATGSPQVSASLANRGATAPPLAHGAAPSDAASIDRALEENFGRPTVTPDGRTVGTAAAEGRRLPPAPITPDAGRVRHATHESPSAQPPAAAPAASGSAGASGSRVVVLASSQEEDGNRVVAPAVETHGDSPRVPLGSHIRAVLLSNLDSRTISGQTIEARLSDDWSDESGNSLPSGTLLYGRADVGGAGERFSLHFTQMKLPVGGVYSVDFSANDPEDAKPGLIASSRILATPQDSGGSDTGKKIALGVAEVGLTAVGGSLGAEAGRTAGQIAVRDAGRSDERRGPGPSGGAIMRESGAQLDLFCNRALPAAP